MKALIISGDRFEDTELLVPYYRFKEAGITVDVAAEKPGYIKGKHHYQVPVDKTFAEVNPQQYDLLFLPGGKAPSKVRKQEGALEIARYFFEHDKPVAAICHGPQILISAGLMQGRHATSFSEVGSELQQAGAVYEDKEVVIDGHLVTSRQPSDLPAFLKETLRIIGKECDTPSHTNRKKRE